MELPVAPTSAERTALSRTAGGMPGRVTTRQVATTIRPRARAALLALFLLPGAAVAQTLPQPTGPAGLAAVTNDPVKKKDVVDAIASKQDAFNPAFSPMFFASALGGVAATPDGVHDDAAHDQSAALQAAIDAMPATGGRLMLPCGNILLRRGVKIPGARITLASGDNQFCSQLVTSAAFPAGDVLTVTGSYSGVDGLAFDVAATSAQLASNNTAFRTGGYTLSLRNGYGFARNLSMRGCFVCVELATHGGHSTLRDITMEYIADGTANPGSGGIDVANVGYGPDNFIDHVRMQPNLGAATIYRPSFGIRLRNTGATLLTNNDVTGMQTSLLIAPGNAQAVEATQSMGNYWDGSAGNGVVIQPTGTGFVMRTSFSHDWCTVVGGGANCLTLIGTGAVSQTAQAYPIMDTVWTGGFMRSIAGQTGTGLAVADAHSRDTVLSHTTLGGWRYAFNIAAGASHVTIDHNTIGIEGNYPGTTQSQANDVGGNVAAGNGDYIQIDHNVFATFRNAALGFAATGPHNRVQDNPGYNPVGIGSVTPGPSPWTFTAGASETDLYLNGGTVGVVSVNGAGLCTATPCRITLSPGQAAVVTYSSAPTVVQSVR